MPGGSWAGEQRGLLCIVSKGHVQALRPLVVLALLCPLLADASGLKRLLSKGPDPGKEGATHLHMGVWV